MCVCIPPASSNVAVVVVSAPATSLAAIVRLPANPSSPTTYRNVARMLPPAATRVHVYARERERVAHA